ncbi:MULTISPECIES: pyridoxal-phosphate dependent enzyme [Pseudomonadaceae]|uniref:pyridoxal-phosphate dependent enzyme n=1 Tax=Pseudomonadaceae TaxID=135621 RepID=UPI0015E2D100|nr:MULTISPECIES: pyridoxal-phosphate dependent enzyme [Pseudomonadaceae]MBA1277907.1 pyridoxal-phosphate dependent enzyme [Stutzerimonas stutzeri]MBC8650252.1 pyridoxal-phosphate dependent enzyme [Pseudomonas sp. MT4]QXY93712.1 pyridoxal-phosphate dependent enzyme [Pseudomonas sp. MTM4]
MPMHVVTPTIYSTALSRMAGLEVMLKIESVQPSGSFKLRGVGHACETLLRSGATHFISSSGGNAGYAVAYAGRQLGVGVTVVVPETTTLKAKELIQSEDARVIVHGSSWQEANAHAQSLLGTGAVFIHPFDHPLLWEGHASMIDELTKQCAKPDVIICSVGGGGLLAGVGEGLLRAGWDDVSILAAETEGAASYAAALKHRYPVEIPAIHSRATSLGARMVCKRSVELTSELSIKSLVLSDSEAFQGSADLLDAHRLLTEPACGVSIASLSRVKDCFPQARRVVVIVCGGIGTSAEQLRDKLQVNREASAG